MALTKLVADVNNIQALSDRPNTADGLTSSELKERFDRAGATIKDYLNHTLTEQLDDAFVDVSTTMNNILTQARNVEYPIGRIVMFYDNLDHSDYLGFTWERCFQGKVPVGINSSDTDFNAIGKTGGEKTHTLTVGEMPSHNHSFYYYHANIAAQTSGSAQVYDVSNRWLNTTKIQNTGGNQAHNIMQPYEVVSFWKRVS